MAAEVHQAPENQEVAGTVGSLGAIAAGVGLASFAPVTGIVLSAVAALAATYFLWDKVHAEQQIDQAVSSSSPNKASESVGPSVPPGSGADI